MQETLRSRIAQLKNQKLQAENFLETARREVTLFDGRLIEATDCLNFLIRQEQEAKEAADKEATKASKKPKKKAKAETNAETNEGAPEDTVEQDIAA